MRWHEDVLFWVGDNEQPNGIDIENLSDSSIVRIEGGYVYGSKWNGNEPSMENYFKRWRRSQKKVSILVECDAARLEAVMAAITAVGATAKKVP